MHRRRSCPLPISSEMDGWTHKLPFYGTDFGPPHLPVSSSAGVPLVRHHHCFIVLHKGAELVFPHAARRKDTHTRSFPPAGSTPHLLVAPCHVPDVKDPLYETGDASGRGRERMKCGLCFKGFSSFCCLSMPHCPSTAADRKNVRDGQQQQSGCVPWCRGPTPSLPRSLSPGTERSLKKQRLTDRPKVGRTGGLT